MILRCHVGCHDGQPALAGAAYCSIRCSRERPRRSSLVTTSWSDGLRHGQGLVELRPAGQLAAGGVDQRRPTPGSGQHVALAIGVLVASADPAVPDAHASECIATTGDGVT